MARDCASRTACRAQTPTHTLPLPPFSPLGFTGSRRAWSRLRLFTGNACVSDVERLPRTLHDAVDALASGTVARAALGDEVVDHYLNYARTEQRLFDRVVTEYERGRLYERG